MINLEKLRTDLEQKLSVDKEIHSVVVRADTIDECLEDAAVQLETKIANLQYEVEEKGFQGVAGLAKKPWKLRIYENPSIVQKKMEAKKQEEMAASQAAEEHKIVDRDGLFYLRHFGSEIYLKVLLPIGSGSPVSQGEVLSAAKRSDTTQIDEPLIKKLCKEGSGEEYVIVGSYNHVAAADASMAVDIPKDEMYATITVSPPAASGSEISIDMIKKALQTQGVVAGIDMEKITEFVDNPVYNTPYEVATAIKPIDGHDAYIAYDFETDTSKMRLKETQNGQVNFKELNLIQNVVAGQRLAQKILAERGKGGKTIFGKYLEAKNGKDIQVMLGSNVVMDKDGRTILAEKNGQVMLVGNKITVEEVYEVPGVNIKTGNITFMGTVIVKGNVEDGYNIKADGNIEVYGSVGNCKIEAEGDIVISQGVMGRDEGVIKTSKSVWARFIQNTKVTAGEYVVVNDNIMNADVSAMKKILLKGKRAQIIGGHLFATEEISAKNIGSPAGGAETILEVGFDPEAKQRLVELQTQQTELAKELDEIDLNISTLENQKEIRRSIPKEKEEALMKFKEQKNEIVEKSDAMTEEINTIQQRLRELKVVGRVNASGTVYAGTKIYVRDELDEIKTDCKAVSFYFENNFVRRGKYDQSQVTSDVGAPDGYSTN